jgi:beta-glucosidase-like glycosyl hydrolase
MSGHIRYPSVDDKIASQSKVWLKDILRSKMGFKGVIISDDIKMGAVDMENTEAAISFIEAGNDMIIIVLDDEGVNSVHESLTTTYKAQDLFGKKSAFWRFVRIASVKSRLEINLSEFNNE